VPFKSKKSISICTINFSTYTNFSYQNFYPLFLQKIGNSLKSIVKEALNYLLPHPLHQTEHFLQKSHVCIASNINEQLISFAYTIKIECIYECL
jgi:hypothetical protein